MKYICKPGHSVSLAKGIIGPPVDPENPTAQEIITDKNFRNGSRGLTALLQHQNCPIVEFDPKPVEKKKVQVTDEISQRPEEKEEKTKGAVKK